MEKKRFSSRISSRTDTTITPQQISALQEADERYKAFTDQAIQAPLDITAQLMGFSEVVHSFSALAHTLNASSRPDVKERLSGLLRQQRQAYLDTASEATHELGHNLSKGTAGIFYLDNPEQTVEMLQQAPTSMLARHADELISSFALKEKQEHLQQKLQTIAIEAQALASSSNLPTEAVQTFLKLDTSSFFNEATKFTKPKTGTSAELTDLLEPKNFASSVQKLVELSTGSKHMAQALATDTAPPGAHLN